MDVEAEIDRLYQFPLEEFTKARNQLAKGLRSAGRRLSRVDPVVALRV
jgi:hypothetical protein